MNALQKTLAMIAFLVLVSQTIRHTYLLWLEPRGSVLDQFDHPLKNEITQAATLDELVRRYEPLRKQVDASRQELAQAGKPLPYGEESRTEPYKSERELREAITDWEAKAKEIRSLRIYWLVGLGLVVVGSLAYRKHSRWFGLAFLIAGFGEFIYWTSPTFFGGSTREFDRLLTNKLVFSLLSLLLLWVAIGMYRIFADPAEKTS